MRVFFDVAVPCVTLTLALSLREREPDNKGEEPLDVRSVLHYTCFLLLQEITEMEKERLYVRSSH